MNLLIRNIIYDQSYRRDNRPLIEFSHYNVVLCRCNVIVIVIGTVLILL